MNYRHRDKLIRSETQRLAFAQLATLQEYLEEEACGPGGAGDEPAVVLACTLQSTANALTLMLMDVASAVRGDRDRDGREQIACALGLLNESLDDPVVQEHEDAETLSAIRAAIDILEEAGVNES